MRLFIAVSFSKDLENTVIKVIQRLKYAGVKGRYVPARNLHMTLAFLGEVTDASAVEEAIRRISWRPFELKLTGIGNFGSLVWLGMDGGKALPALAEKIREALDGAGIPYDRKKFVPHITLIRKAAGHWQGIGSPGGTMVVDHISLMKSEVKDGKRVYTEIFRVTGGRKKREDEGS